MYIVCDFDGTVVDHTFPKIGSPVPMALEYLKYFQSRGAKIILFTMRSDGGQHGDVLTEAVDYLEENGIELFGVNVNPTQKSWTTSPKAYGNVYIDDAAAGCPLLEIPGFNRPCVNWSKIGGDILKRLL